MALQTEGHLHVRGSPSRVRSLTLAVRTSPRYGFGVKTKVGFGEKRPGSDFGSGSSPASPAGALDAGGEAELRVVVEAVAAVTITALLAWPAVEVVISLPFASR